MSETMRQRLWYAIGQAITAQFDGEFAAPIIVLTPLVDAILAEMREPTEAMIHCAMDAGAKLHPYAGQDAWARTHWQAMIDAASKAPA